MAHLVKFSWRDWTIIVMAIVLVGVAVRGQIRESRYAREGRESHNYLCYQKRVVIPERIRDTLQYAVDIQEGRRASIPGITVADIQTGVKRDEDTLKALSLVHC